MSESKAKTLREWNDLAYDYSYKITIGIETVPNDIKLLKFEDYQQEIQKLDKLVEKLVEAWMLQSHLFEEEKKVLEGCLYQARQLAKEAPITEELQFCYRTTGHIKEWYRKLLGVLSNGST